MIVDVLQKLEDDYTAKCEWTLGVEGEVSKVSSRQSFELLTSEGQLSSAQEKRRPLVIFGI